jgi:HK97 gp10 family phage protein
MEVKCTVDFGDIAEKLNQIGPKLARRALRKGVSKVGDMWVTEMKARVPVDNGDLQTSIDKRVTTRGKGGISSAKVAVGPSYDKSMKGVGKAYEQPGVYGMFVELGTKRSKATPYMRPTFDTTADNAVQILADVLQEELFGIVKS